MVIEAFVEAAATVGGGGAAEGSVGALVGYVVLALGVSFLCSFLESVLLSVTLGHAKVLVEQGAKGALLLERLKTEPERPLTAILTLNTVAHTAGAVGVGSQVSALYGEAWLTAASVLMTIAVLLFSEIIPKTVGTLSWKRSAIPVARITNWLTWGLIWIVWPIEKTRALFPVGAQSTVTREELRVLAGVGEDEGEIELDERDVITNLLQMQDVKVEDVMTPRVVLTAFPAAKTVAEVVKENTDLPHARIPVYGLDLDDVQGVVLRARVLRAAIDGRLKSTMGDLSGPVLTCLPTDDVDGMLDRMLEEGVHLLVVKDEFGGTAGVITMEDIIETLLGREIVDESDPAEDMRELAKQIYVDASAEAPSEAAVDAAVEATVEAVGEVVAEDGTAVAADAAEDGPGGTDEGGDGGKDEEA